MRVGEFLYTDEELALILNRAAELQEGGARPGDARYTLAEIQEIAAGAGIAASDVAAVAAGLRDNRERSPHGLLGAPWRFRSEETIDGEVSDDVVGELIDIARRELGLQGRITEALGAVEWTGRDNFGATGSSWISMRVIWRRFARRYAERTTALSAALISAARRAVEEGRVTAM